MCEKKKISNKVIGGTLSLTISALIVKLLGLVYKIPLSYILTDEGLGFFNSAYTVYSFFYLISVAGVPKAVTIIMSDADVRGVYGEKKKIYKTALTAFFLIGLLLSMALALFSGKISNFIGNPKATAAMIVVAPSILFTAISGVVRGFLCAEMKFSHVAISQIIDAVLRCVCGTLFAIFASSQNMPMYSIAAFTILGSTVAVTVSTIYLLAVSKNHNAEQKTWQKPKVSFKKSDILKKIFRISIPITLGAAAMSMTNLIDLALIMRRLISIGYTASGASALYGNYTTLVVPMIGLAGALISPISVSITPLLASAHSSSNKKSFVSHLDYAMRLCAFISVPMAVGMMFYGREALFLIFDDYAAEIAAPLLSIAATGIIFTSSVTIVNTALEASGIVKAPIYTTLIGATFKLLLSYYLIGRADVGISGAPIGTVFSYGIILILGIIILYIKCKVKVSVLSSFFVPAISSFLMILLSKCMSLLFIHKVSYTLYSIICIISCVAFYLFFTYLFYYFGKSNIYIRQNAQKNEPNIV